MSENENDTMESEEMEELRAELNLLRKDYTVGMLGNLVDTLNETLQTITENDAKKVFYDKELGQSISGAILKVVKQISEIKELNVKVDLTPIIAVASDISKQNKGILEVMNRLTKPETNDAKYQELLKMTLEMVAKNNKFLETGLKEILTKKELVAEKQPDYTKQLSGINEKLDKRPDEWRFTIEYDRSRIKEVIAKAK